MIYITGDTHRDIDWSKLNTENFPEQKNLTKKDYVIVCGDFGGVWNGNRKDNYVLDNFNNRNFTLLFIDGNHENFEALNSYPVEMWNGGKIHRIRDSVIHLMRGQVYTIDGITFFTFGGAKSTDKERRREFISWWKEEEPSYQEMNEGLDNLEKVGNKVDVILTHTCPSELIKVFDKYPILEYQGQINTYLDEINERVEFEKWYFGHHHADINLGKYRMLYQDVVKLEL